MEVVYYKMYLVVQWERYMNVISSYERNILLSLQLKEELKSLEKLLKILIDKGIDITEKAPGASKTNLLSVMKPCSHKSYIPHAQEFHNLILILSQHPDFGRIIDERYYAHCFQGYLTIRELAKRYQFLETVKLLESIKKTRASCV